MKTFKIIKPLVLFVFAVITVSCDSQNLERNIFLGAQLMDLSSVDQDLRTDFGLYLPEILPHASFGKMGIPKGSVLQQINAKKIHSISELFRVIEGVKAGDDLEVTVFYNGENKTYKGKAIGKQKEAHPNATVKYGQVVYEDNVLRSLLYLPNNVKQPPVVFFLQGYTCQSIEMQNSNPAKQLIDQWIAKDYAVFLVEKPGMGDSKSAISCSEIDFNQELMAFSKAYESLQNNSRVDTENIFLFGHSMGGIIAPLLAQEKAPAGIITYGIIGKSWYDYMKDIYTEQRLIFGASEESIKADNQYNLPFIKDLLVNKKSNTELINSKVYGEFLKQDGTAQALEDGQYIGRHYTYWQTLSDVDIPEIWSKVKVPVYVIHGEYDIQAIHPKYGKVIATNVNKNQGNAKFEIIPKSEHAFLKFDSQDELIRMINNGTYVNTFTTNFNPEIGEKSLIWMNSNLN